MKSHDLVGTKALVTGGAVRVGKALALGLAQAGCDVIVHYASSGREANEVVNTITQLGRRAAALQADFRDPTAPQNLAHHALEVFGGLDILINSASVYPEPEKTEAKNSILDEQLSDWELALSINARAPFFLTQHLAPALKKSRNGNVVNILDSSFSNVFVSRASHTVSKWALAAITQLGAKTLAPDVRVNALELGSILPSEKMSAGDQAKRKWIGTDEVVEALLRVLRSPSVSGEVIPVGVGRPPPTKG